MNEHIVRFPRRNKDKKRLEARKGKLSCEVSERWIKFPDASDKHNEMEYLSLDVMTVGSDSKDKKLCEIILDKQQLLSMLMDLPVNDFTQT